MNIIDNVAAVGTVGIVGAVGTLGAVNMPDAGRSVLPMPGLSLYEAARRIRDGDLSPVTLLEQCLQRIASLDGEIHAFTTLSIDAARRDAQHAATEIAAGYWRGPLHGIPVSIKDVIDVAGLPTLAQSRQRADSPIPVANAAAVACLIEAGAIVIGKTTTHEYAFGGPDWQQTTHLPSATAQPGTAARNPWCTDRFAGGSSSGAAAGVACGMALGALGSDTAGSVRSPAALCGMTGFKPGRNTVDRTGCLPLADSLDAMGLIAESAQDCALLFGAVTGAVMGATTGAVKGAMPDSLTGTLSGVKIGVLRHFFTDGVPIAQTTVEHIDNALHVLKDAGAVVHDTTCPSLQSWQAAGMTILLAEAFALHAPQLRDRLDHYGKSFADAVMLGATISDADYRAAVALRGTLRTAIDQLMNDYDLLIAPIQPDEAPRLADLSPWGFLQRPSYGIPFNLADMPALSLCCGFGPNGMPLALQLIGARGNEAVVLNAAHGYQMRTDWHLRHRQGVPGIEQFIQGTSSCMKHCA